MEVSPCRTEVADSMRPLTNETAADTISTVSVLMESLFLRLCHRSEDLVLFLCSLSVICLPGFHVHLILIYRRCLKALSPCYFVILKMFRVHTCGHIQHNHQLLITVEMKLISALAMRLLDVLQVTFVCFQEYLWW